jgi:hypothetical protein
MKEEEEKEKEKEKAPPVPPQRGKLIFEGRKATQFWLRAFNLEAEIEAVREMIGAKPERKRAAVPIVAEYTVDERLKFIFLIQAEIDTLGIQGGAGFVYWASPEYEKEAFEIRDEHAEDILQRMETSRKFEEVIELEVKRET